ncbi:MAG TPA: Ku protein [Planctomycetota bacterium]|nr:Ku protein [Planctomycetota bacterium]
MRSMWKGFVSFGLVSIPVKLYSAVEQQSGTEMHQIHDADHGKIHFKRFCELCGEEVEWAHVAKGVRVAEGEYVEITDEDFARADVAATQTIDILDFAAEEQLDWKHLERPYYLEPQKGSERPYALLREALRKRGRVGLAKVVLRAREQLAAIRVQGDMLVLEMLRFADEVRDPEELTLPAASEARERELALAEQLVDQMTVKKLDLAKYKDEYQAKLREVIEEKVAGREPAARGEAPKPTKVVDLMEVLKKSLGDKSGEGAGAKAEAKAHEKPRHAPAKRHAPRKAHPRKTG